MENHVDQKDVYSYEVRSDAALCRTMSAALSLSII